MERRFSFRAGVVGLAARLKEKQAVIADGSGTVSCIGVKVSTVHCLNCLLLLLIFSALIIQHVCSFK